MSDLVCDQCILRVHNATRTFRCNVGGVSGQRHASVVAKAPVTTSIPHARYRDPAGRHGNPLAKSTHLVMPAALTTQQTVSHTAPTPGSFSQPNSSLLPGQC
jgi:hypothetical protein